MNAAILFATITVRIWRDLTSVHVMMVTISTLMEIVV